MALGEKTLSGSCIQIPIALPTPSSPDDSLANESHHGQTAWAHTEYSLHPDAFLEEHAFDSHQPNFALEEQDGRSFTTAIFFVFSSGSTNPGGNASSAANFGRLALGLTGRVDLEAEVTRPL